MAKSKETNQKRTSSTKQVETKATSEIETDIDIDSVRIVETLCDPSTKKLEISRSLKMIEKMGAAGAEYLPHVVALLHRFYQAEPSAADSDVIRLAERTLKSCVGNPEQEEPVAHDSVTLAQIADSIRNLECQISDAVGEHESLADAIRNTVQEAVRASSQAKTSRSESMEINDYEKDVFEILKTKTPEAMEFQQVQDVLNRLTGTSVSEPGVHLLKEFLKTNQWYVACVKCGSPSTPVWQRSAAKSTGGSIIFAHPSPSGGYVQHASRTKYPELRLVKK